MMVIAFNHHRKLLGGDDTTTEDEQSGIHESCLLHCDAQQNPPPLALLSGEAPSPAVQLISHSKYSNISLFLVVVLSVLITGFFFLTCCAIYKLYMRWQRSRTRQRSLISREPEPDDFIDEDYGPVLDHPIWYIRTIGLQPSVISSIAVVRFRKGDGLVEGTNCLICLSEFEEDEEVRLLPKCSHAFHVPCIDTWLRSHTNCPMCRAQIVPNSSGLEEESGGRSGSDGEVVRDLSGNDGAEVTIRLNEGDEQEQTQDSEHQVGFKIINESLGEKGGSYSDGGELDGIIQPMRRSVSFDSLFASRISGGIVNALPGKSNGNLITNQLIKGKELLSSSSSTVKDQVGANQSFFVLVQSSSRERSMQRESCCSVKRSVSCSGKVFLSSYGSRNQNSACSR